MLKTLWWSSQWRRDHSRENTHLMQNSHEQLNFLLGKIKFRHEIIYVKLLR